MPLKLIVPVLPVKVPPLPKLPPMFNLPASVKVNWAGAAVPLKVILPLKLAVPVLILKIVFRPAVALPAMEREVAPERVPASTAKSEPGEAVAAFMVIVLVRVSELVLAAKVKPFWVALLLALMVMEVAAAA